MDDVSIILLFFHIIFKNVPILLVTDWLKEFEQLNEYQVKQILLHGVSYNDIISGNRGIEIGIAQLIQRRDTDCTDQDSGFAFSQTWDFLSSLQRSDQHWSLPSLLSNG
jgi:hypothetical protein